jgi:hypothetical protein
MNAKPVTRYPRGGSALWTDGSEGAALINAEFFGAAAPANIEGTLSATLADATLVATGTLPASGITGELTATLGAATLASAGTLRIAGTLTGTLGAATLSATGVLGALPAITGELSATLGDATLEAVGTLPGEPPAVNFGWGGGYNADREWFEREERERQEAAQRAAQAQQEERQADATPEPPAPRTDALVAIAPTPAPFVRRGPAPRVVFASLVASLQALAERQAIERAEAERIAAEAFAAEQQRIAIEAAIRQQMLDDEAAEALMALLMND